MYKFWCKHMFSGLLGMYVPRGGIAGSYGNSVFNFLGNCQTPLSFEILLSSLIFPRALFKIF